MPDGESRRAATLEAEAPAPPQPVALPPAAAAPDSHGFGLHFWLLVVATFIGFLGIGAVIPALGPHVRRDLQGSDVAVGFIIGVFSVVALLSRFLSGPLADRRGRKLTFAVGLVSCSLAGFAYLMPLGLVAPFVGRMLQGFGEACLYTGAAAWIVELADEGRKARALSYLSSGIWGGISVGPVVGGWLGTFERVAWVQALLPLLAIGALWLVPENYHPPEQQGPRRWVPAGALWPGLTLGLVNVQYPTMAGFLALHLASHGGSGPRAFAVYAALILLSRFFLGGLPDRLGSTRTFYAGLISMAAGLAIIATGPPPALAILGAGLVGFGFSFPWPALASAVLNRAAPSERASSIGVLTASVDLFVGLSSFTAGGLAARFGYPAIYWMACAAVAAAGVLGWRVLRPAHNAR